MESEEVRWHVKPTDDDVILYIHIYVIISTCVDKAIKTHTHTHMALSGHLVLLHAFVLRWLLLLGL